MRSLVETILNPMAYMYVKLLIALIRLIKKQVLNT